MGCDPMTAFGRWVRQGDGMIGEGFAKALLLCMSMSMLANQARALTPIDDGELSIITGQSLFASNYIPLGSGNPNTDISFFRLMIDAQIDLNVNIRKLALGCGGVNGAGGCDIDIDNLSMTGMAGSGVDAGPPTDFVLYRPYLEFAIKNPGSLANRSVAGFRIGAIESFGSLGVGTRPAGIDNDPSHHTGINSFSGDLQARVINGQLPVSLCLIGGANADRTACNFGVGVPAGNATINTNDPNNGDNIFNLVLQREGTGAKAPTLTPVVAIALGLLSLNADFTEDLRFFHSLDLGSDANGDGKFSPGEGTKDFYISLEKQAVTWQKISSSSFSGAIPAQRGWWMSVPSVTLRDFTGRRVYAGAGEAVGNLLGGPNIAIPGVDLNMKAVDNCWGSLTFC